MNIMNQQEQRRKVLGAWLGKAVGGTLGQPWEGCDGPLALRFYDPVPQGMMPNDDLDLQVVWACRLAGDWQGCVSRANFADAWLHNIDFPCDEYGVVIRNLKLGIPAPWSGIYDNFFTDGLGGAIRSEIWAVLAPGDPVQAARLAGIDAQLDHAGNGIYAEQFLAALESCAFTEENLEKLIQAGLSVIPADCALSHSIRDTVTWCRTTEDPATIRQWIMSRYGSDNFTDVKMNLAFVTAALLLGKGDFAKTVCTAVNFGQDADCTGATAGAILGILNPDAIPSAWLKPIGRALVLNEGITGIEPPPDLEAFSNLLLGLRGRIRVDESTAPEPDFSRFEIPCCQSFFRPWFASDFRKFAPRPQQGGRRLRLPGNLTEVDFREQPGESLQMLEIPFQLEREERVRLVVNTPANLLVWVDGTFCFGRNGGAMVPAFHRALINQMADLVLTAGRHRLWIGLAPAAPAMKRAPLFFGLADVQNQWIPHAFLRGETV